MMRWAQPQVANANRRVQPKKQQQKMVQTKEGTASGALDGPGDLTGGCGDNVYH